MEPANNTAIILAIIAFILDLSVTYDPGYCQVYGYNRKGSRDTRSHDKHYFACCTNPDDQACRGLTYQEPILSDELCGVTSSDAENSHRTGLDTSFGDSGSFPCGGCCGQQRAWKTCNEHFIQTPRTQCKGWVTCFHRECKKFVDLRNTSKQGDCDRSSLLTQLSHIREVLKNQSGYSSMTSSGSGINVAEPPESYLDMCSRCEELDKKTRCTLTCCESKCCERTPKLRISRGGGTSFSEPSAVFLGLKPLQIAGIAFGSILLMAALVGAALVIIRRVVPGCESLGPKREDTQILVIEGQEEPDSDQESNE